MTKKKSSKTIGLVILHNDLRIHDNATLLKASATCDSLLIVYPKQKLFQPSINRGQSYHDGQDNKMGHAREKFLYQTLNSLNISLQKLGNALLLLDNKRTGISTFNQLKQIIHDFKVGHIFVSQTADYDQNQAYKLLTDHLDNATIQANRPKIQWYYTTTSTLFDRCPIVDLPRIFSQFRKQIETSYHLLSANSDLLISPTPSVLPDMPLMSTEYANTVKFVLPAHIDKTLSNTISTCTTNTYPDDFHTSYLDSPFIGGEKNALAHVDKYFQSNAPQTYKKTRNTLFLIDDNSNNISWLQTTRFSPWLANGSLSIRILLNRLRRYEKEVAANDSTYWIWFELLWREYFYWYGKEHGRKLFWFSGITGKKPRTSFYGERFERWKQGNTTYPIVNACMKQLNATGYISNRGRQLVASCFIHELAMDWRYGASYFEQQLIDYDVTSNWGNWQYLAGVGADPRGSRRFNLTKQTEQYDPKRYFITKWNGDTVVQHTDSVDIVDWYIE